MGKLIINTVVTFIVSGVLGYSVSIIKNFRSHKNTILNEFKQIKESQMEDMKADIANKFFIYDAMDQVEDYLYLSWQEKAERYFKLGGNSFIHQLYEKSKKWKIKHTHYLD